MMSLGPPSSALHIEIQADVEIKHRARILHVYRQTWNEFYAWEQESQQMHLSAMASSASSISPASPAASGLAHFEAVSQLVGEAGDPGPEFLSDWGPISGQDYTSDSPFHAYNFDNDPDNTYTVLSCTDGPRPAYVCPHPRYFACTPTDRIMVSGGINDILPDESASGDPITVFFIPFDGEVHFNGKERFGTQAYVKQFKDLAWQTQFKDPDCMFCALSSLLPLLTLSFSGSSSVTVILATTLTCLVRPITGLNELLEDQQPLSSADIDQEEVLPATVSNIIYDITSRCA